MKKVNIFICAFTGIIFSIIGLLFIDDKLLVILAGFLFALFLYPCLVYSTHKMNKKYESADRMISAPVIFKATGNFSDASVFITKNGNLYPKRFVLHGVFYVCEDRLYFIIFHGNEMRVVKILRDDMVSVEVTNDITCEIVIKMNGELMCIFHTAQAKQLAEVLKENNWFTAW